MQAKITRRCFYLSLFLFLIFSTPVSSAIAPWEIDGLKDQPAPAFQLEDINGNKLSNESLAGKVVLLNFWATWCPPCLHEMPVFGKLYQKFKTKGFVIAGISVDSSEDLVKAFMKKKPVPFPVAVDLDKTITEQYKVFTFPTTFLIDRSGTIREIYLGEQEWEEDEFIKTLQKYLETK